MGVCNMSEDYSGLESKDTLEANYNKLGSRLPTEPIPDEVKECDSFDLKTIDIQRANK